MALIRQMAVDGVIDIPEPTPEPEPAPRRSPVADVASDWGADWASDWGVATSSPPRRFSPNGRPTITIATSGEFETVPPPREIFVPHDAESVDFPIQTAIGYSRCRVDGLQPGERRLVTLPDGQQVVVVRPEVWPGRGTATVPL